MARGLVRMERDSGFCICMRGAEKEDRPLKPQLYCTPRGQLGCRDRYHTHLLQEDRELQTELFLQLRVPCEQRHIDHHLPEGRGDWKLYTVKEAPSSPRQCTWRLLEGREG